LLAYTGNVTIMAARDQPQPVGGESIYLLMANVSSETKSMK
jgi:hypothetical protein